MHAYINLVRSVVELVVTDLQGYIHSARFLATAYVHILSSGLQCLVGHKQCRIDW